MNKPISTNPTADLPVNWTTSQIVSPSGTDVGLTAKHGYNYLMQKLNEALTDIGTINDAFTGISVDITGGASSIVSSNLTASKALVSNSSGKVAASSVSSTELGYLSGVTSAIQTQLNGKQASGSYKSTQSAVSDPTASGTSITFISTLSQNTQGVITPTKATVSTMGAASASAAGSAGLVPAPAKGKQTSFLRGDGTWVVPDNTTYSAATTSTAGLMSAADKTKLNGIATGANAYSLPTASASTLGGVKVGTNLSISSGVLSATNTTYSAGTGLSLSSTTFNHSNSVTAQTTQAVYPIKIDAQGHISAYGSAQTILALGTTATTAAKGNHTHATSIATSSSTNQLTLAYGTKYAITAGGTSYVFTMPSAPTAVFG